MCKDITTLKEDIEHVTNVLQMMSQMNFITCLFVRTLHQYVKNASHVFTLHDQIIINIISYSIHMIK